MHLRASGSHTFPLGHALRERPLEPGNASLDTHRFKDGKYTFPVGQSIPTMP